MNLKDRKDAYHRMVTVLRYGLYSRQTEDRMVKAFTPEGMESAGHMIGATVAQGAAFNDLENQVRLAIRHGFFLRIVATTEQALKDRCEILRNEKKCPIGVQSLRASSLRKFRDYLEAIGALDFSAVDTHWKQMEYLFLIRHAWAHADGLLDGDNSNKLRNFVAKNASYVRIENSTVIIEPEAVTLAGDTAVTVLQHMGFRDPNPCEST